MKEKSALLRSQKIELLATPVIMIITVVFVAFLGSTYLGEPSENFLSLPLVLGVFVGVLLAGIYDLKQKFNEVLHTEKITRISLGFVFFVTVGSIILNSFRLIGTWDLIMILSFSVGGTVGGICIIYLLVFKRSSGY